MLTLTLTSGTLAGLGILSAAPAVATGPVCNQPTVTYAAGAAGSYTVPAGAHTVDVVASGAGAVASQSSYAGGRGATVSTTLNVTPGEVLDYAVGTTGDRASGGLSGGAPSGGSVSLYFGNTYGSGGGGATFIRNAGAVLVAAGGGGGAGHIAIGGNAAPTTGTPTTGVFTGGNGVGYFGNTATGGSSTVGIGSPAGTSGGAGYNGVGQVGGNGGDSSGSGGGGGGYQGGGGGAFGSGAPSPGGAGSSYVAGNYTIVANGGNGSLSLSAPADPVFQSAATNLFIMGQNSSFLVCAPGGPGTTLTSSGSLPAGMTFTDNGNGTATLSGTATVAGTFPLTFTSISSVTTETQTFSLVVHDISAKTLVVSASPTSVTAGGLMTSTVTAYDAQGAVATTDQDAISITSTDAQVTVPGGHLVNGATTFTAHPKTVGAQTFTVTDGGITGTSNAVTVTPAAATSYTVVQPSAATAGDSVNAVITAKDPYGNVDTNDTASVSLSSTDSNATLAPSTALTAGTVTLPVTYTTAGSQQLRATGGGFFGDANPIAVGPAATSSLSLSGPASVVAGSSNAMTVQPFDSYGNQTSPSDVLHFTSTDANAVLPDDAAWDSVSGNYSVTFKTAGDQTLTVTDLTDPSVLPSTLALTVEPGDAQAVATTSGNLQSVPAAHAFAPLAALVTDAEGNPVPGQQVVFSVPDGSASLFAGSTTDAVLTDTNGIATTDVVLTAGTTPGVVTVNAATSTPMLLLTSNPRSPVVDGSTSFTETVTASDAAVLATPKTSTGIGTAAQSATVTVPAGDSVSLLNPTGDQVTMVFTPDGTFVLNPTTGLISFVATAGFVGTATPVTYQVTDSYEQLATSTYTPTVTAPAPVVPPANPVSPPVAPVVHPLGVAHVGTASHVVLTGSTVSATCTVSVAALKTCQTDLTATIAGRQVVLGTSNMVKGRTGAMKVSTVITLNTLGRAMAAQVGGVKATAWASVTKADGRTLSAKAPISIVAKHVPVTARVLFPTSSTTLSTAAKHQLTALKAKLARVKTITCVGYADTAGDPVANLALGKARAQAVCAALAGHGVKLVVLTHGDSHPTANNTTAAGRTLNRRVEITLTY